MASFVNAINESAIQGDLIDHAGFGIIVFDIKSLVISRINPAVSAMTGQKKDLLISKPVTDLFSDKTPFLGWDGASSLKFETELKTENPPSLIVEADICRVSEKEAMLSLMDISEHHQKAESYKQERDGLREFFENIPVAAYRNTGGPVGKFLLANPAQLKLFRCKTFEEFCSIPVSETYQDPSQRETVVRELQEKGYVLRKELQLLKSDKTPFWGAITVQAIYDKAGNFKWFDGIIEDITERKQHEKLTQTLFRISNAANTAPNLEDLYQSIYDSLNHLMPLPNFYISLYNRENNSIFFPFHRDQFDSENSYFLPADNIDDCRLICVDVIKSRKPLFMDKEMCAQRASGHEIVGVLPVVWLGVPLLIRDEVIGSIIVQHYSDPEYFTLKDLDLFVAVSDQIALAIDRKRAQEAILEHQKTLEKTVQMRTRELQRAMEELSESEKRFRETIELLPEVLFETNDAYTLTYVNQKAFELLQYTRQDLEKGIHILDLIHKEDQDRAEEDMMTILYGRASADPEYTTVKKDGTCFPAMMNFRPVLKKGKFAGLRGIIIDITLQKKAQREREERIGMDKEIEIAKNIQTALLPCLEKFKLSHYEISANMTPSQDVGGDYYDLIVSPDNRLWVGIGDVTGHGLVSGLIMMMTQVSMSTLIRSVPGLLPEDVLIHANRVIQSNIREGLKVDHHMTISLMVEEEEGLFRYAGAHETLLIYRAGTKHVDRIPTRGMWLGILPDISKPTKKYAGKFSLEKDDVLLLYTDGVIEAFNDRREQFDMDLLVAFLKTHAQKSTEMMKYLLLQELNAFMVSQADDISFLILKKK